MLASRPLKIGTLTTDLVVLLFKLNVGHGRSGPGPEHPNFLTFRPFTGWAFRPFFALFLFIQRHHNSAGCLGQGVETVCFTLKFCLF